MEPRIRRLVLTSLLCLMASPTPSWAIWPSNYNDAVPICQAANAQAKPVICSDGDGGAFIAWEDNRFSGVTWVVVNHVLANGDLAPGWMSWGNYIDQLGVYEFDPAICADGSGGCIVVWRSIRSIPTGNYDVYAQRVTSSGTTLWTANGLQLCNAAATQQLPKVINDNGGAYVAWEDQRNGGSNYDIYGQRITSAGALAGGWGGLTGKAIETSAGNQYAPRIAADGIGGVLVSYLDPSFYGLVKRVSSGGTVSGSPWGTMYLGYDFDWAPDGLGGVLSASLSAGTISFQRIDPTGAIQWAGGYTPGFESAANVRVVSDGVGGLIASYDYGTTGTLMIRIGSGGAIAPGWPVTGGRVILSQSNGSPDHLLLSDGSRGALLLFSQQVTGPNRDIWAQHVDQDGHVVSEWDFPGSGGANGGRAVSLAPLDQISVCAASDMVGGAIVAWADQRPGLGNDDIYAQRIDFYGQVGYPEPKIAEVKDVKSDQGGQIRIRWAASYLDSIERRIQSYSVWRQVPPSAANLLQHDRTVLATSARDARERFRALAAKGSNQRVLMPEATTAGVVFWEFLASLDAHGNGTYSYVASTTSDSSGSGNPFTIVRVDAVDTYNGDDIAWWRSKPDSGYSVDNLAPNPPNPAAGAYASGSSTLHWHPNSETDIANYRLYRGTDPSFPANGGALIASPPDTQYVDPAGAPYYYKVSAIDIHGNESGATLITPSGVLDVLSGYPELFLAGIVPNPVAGQGSCGFRLSRAGPVRLTLHDIQGRLVRTLVDGWRDSGIQSVDWDGTDDAGRRLTPGMYVVRMAAEGRMLMRKAVVAR